MSKLLTFDKALQLLGLSKRALYDWPPEKRPPFWIKKLKAVGRTERCITLEALRAWTREQEIEPQVGRGRRLTGKGPGRHLWPE